MKTFRFALALVLWAITAIHLQAVAELTRREWKVDGVAREALVYVPANAKTEACPVIFAFHGYPWLIHRLTYRRTNHSNLHVRGYKEEGTTTTPFDMVVLNEMDRFHLVEDVIDRLPQLGARAAYFKQAIRDRLLEHKEYIDKFGDDMPEIAGWQWGAKGRARAPRTSTAGDNE